jgi:superoxide dismutase, Fe-Mn family
MISRRDFVISGGMAGLAFTTGGFAVSGELWAQTAAPGGQMGTSTSGAASKGAPFTLPDLRYPFDALQPHIDAKTMELHHGKHHLAYVEKLNAAIGKHPDLTQMVLPDLLPNLDKVPEDVRQDIRNNGGGHANHTMFWTIMSPDGGRNPKGGIAAAINQGFGSLDEMKKAVNGAGQKHFGSGWVFVVVDPKSGKMEVVARANQDTPLMEGKRVLLGNDLWEHAFYLKYNNRKADYLEAWWNVVDWNEIGRRYDAIRSGDAVI